MIFFTPLRKKKKQISTSFENNQIILHPILSRSSLHSSLHSSSQFHGLLLNQKQQRQGEEVASRVSMAKTVLSSSPFLTTSLLPSSHSRPLFGIPSLRPRKIGGGIVRLSMHEAVSQFDLQSTITKAEAILYTISDAAVATVDSAVAGSATTTTETVQKSGGWFGFISDALEVVLKVLKDGLTTVHVPYAYGFAIILLTLIVKAATFPLTKQQVESTLAMQNLQPKIKAIQKRYAGNQERIQLETARLYKQAGVNPLAGCLPTLATIPIWIGLYQALSNVANEGLLTEGFFWIPSLGGPTSIAARQSGAGISWLFPFVDGQPPLGWHDTTAYLVLPVLLVLAQYVSMEIMKPPQSDDPAAKNTMLVFKFLPLMIGYFSLSVPSGLSIYWFINNVLSTGQQVWLRKLGGAKPVVDQSVSGIISAGQAKRTISEPVASLESKSGDRFKQLKDEERRKKLNKSLQLQDAQMVASTSDSVDSSGEGDDAEDKEELEAYASTPSGSKQGVDYSSERKGKRSKRKRANQT